MKQISENRVWALCGKEGKSVPYRGYGVEFADKRFLSHGKDGIWRLFDSGDEARQWANAEPSKPWPRA